MVGRESATLLTLGLATEECLGSLSSSGPKANVTPERCFEMLEFRSPSKELLLFILFSIFVHDCDCTDNTFNGPMA